MLASVIILTKNQKSYMESTLPIESYIWEGYFERLKYWLTRFTKGDPYKNLKLLQK